jgi:diacylglycerol kinase (ATP)
LWKAFLLMTIAPNIHKLFYHSVDIIASAENKERKIIYLVNPISGTAKKQKIIELIEKETKAQNIHCQFLNTNKEGRYNSLKEKIEAENITDVVMIGGDGTVNQVVGALHYCNVNFGIIPVGSGNGLARAAHIPLKLKAALSLIFTGEAKYIDAFWVNNKFSCMLSGLGFDAQVAHDFSTKATRGLLTYTQQSIANFFKAAPYQFEVEINEFKFFTDAFFVSIANSNQFGNNVTIAPKAKLSDGLLDIVIVQKMSKAKLPFAILQQIRGNNKLEEMVEQVTQKSILYFQTPNLKIKNLKQAPLHIDGEPAETTTDFEIKIIKDCFRLYH